MKKYIKDMLKSFTCGALIGSVCWCFAISSTAASAQGQSTKDTVNGVSYTMQNSMSTGNNTASAYTFNTASRVLQAGSLGVRPMLCSADGRIVSQRDWIYSNRGSGLSAYARTTDSTSDYYYSWGDARVWDDSKNDYIEYALDRTPNVRFE
ncbi:MAG: hypothetical protein K2K89_02860 [Ruminococcus sp.]|nr:hypothetical protein [Ruminococcus sp.]